MPQPLWVGEPASPRLLADRADTEALRVLRLLLAVDTHRRPALSRTLLPAVGAALAVVAVVALYVLVVMQLS